MKTERGLAVTTESPQVIAGINQFHYQMVASGTTPELILEVVKDNPDNFLVQTYAAIFYLYGQTDSATAQAKTHLMRAEQLIKHSNMREQLIFQAAKSWLHQEYVQAIKYLRQVTELYPRDTLAAKCAEGLFYCVGQAHYGHQYLALCQKMAQENVDDPYFLSMYSFASELAGHTYAAEQLAEQAIQIEPLTPWAHHTLAHVYLNTHAMVHGAQRLAAFRDSWAYVLPLLCGHNTWHLALFYLAARQEDKVMSLYSDIFGAFPTIISEQIDALSLLWRMELAGMAQPDHLAALTPYIGHTPFEHYMGFNTLHYIYYLSRCASEKEVLVAIESIKQKSKEPGQKLWMTLVFPLSKAIYAMAKDDFLAAYELMTPCISRRCELGGSDAQSELFAQVYLQCLLKLNKMNEARVYFNFNLAHYQNTELARYWFGV